MATMPMGSMEMQPKMAEGASLFRPTLTAFESEISNRLESPLKHDFAMPDKRHSKLANCSKL